MYFLNNYTKISAKVRIFLQSHPIYEEKQYRKMRNKNKVRLTESQLNRVIKEAVNEVLSDVHFPPSEGHPDIYNGGKRSGSKYRLNFGADYGYKTDSCLYKGYSPNPNAKRTEWMWIQDMVNHANDLFSEYHMYDEEAYEAIEKLYELLKQGLPESDAVDAIGDKFYRDKKAK